MINEYDGAVLIPQAGRSRLLELSERMMRSFCSDFSASMFNRWRTWTVSGAEYEVMARSIVNVCDHGRPPGTTLAFATTLWLPVPPKPLFDFLRDEDSRAKVIKLATYKYMLLINSTRAVLCVLDNWDHQLYIISY